MAELACQHLGQRIKTLLNSQYEQILERDDWVSEIVEILARLADQPPDCYIYILLDPRKLPTDEESNVQDWEEAVRNAAFYPGMGQGNRIHTHQKAKTGEPRYQRMREIITAERGYLAIKVLEGVSKFIALQLEGLLIRSWPVGHLTKRNGGSASKILKGELERQCAMQLQEWAIKGILKKDLKRSAELPFLGGDGLFPQ